MELIELLVLKAQGMIMAREGYRIPQARRTVLQQKLRGNESEVLAMPVDPRQWQPMQVLDTGSADFGKRYFIPDYDAPDDTDHPHRV